MRIALLSASAFLGLAGPAFAEVVEAASAGFQVAGEVAIAAPPAEVWATLIAPARWWGSDHTWSGDATALTLDLRPGGCWCEPGPDGAGAVHMTVSLVDPGKTLRLSGALGPLQTIAATGAMSLEVRADGEGSTLVWSYAVGGYQPGGSMEAWAAPVDGVLTEQFGRLKAEAEAEAEGGE